MIEHLKSDEIVNKVGGRFKLCALIQRRLVELMEGARPLVERQGRSDLEVAIEEIAQDKITIGSIHDVPAPVETRSLKSSSRSGALL
jgi:DNA-directed RNA polymerase subunit omega